MRRASSGRAATTGACIISRDNCATWSEITPPALPEWSLISTIEASPHEAGSAYLAATRYKMDDCRPLLFKTSDYGATWTAINSGLPADAITRVVREDPARRGLLYCGTETGVSVSFDDGGAWEPLTGNFPVVPVHDLIVEGSDLIVATHGRSFWVLDDLTALREATNVADGRGTYLFVPRPHLRLKAYQGFGSAPGTAMSYRNAGPLPVTYRRVQGASGEMEDALVNAGQNPPAGVIVRYFLPEKPTSAVALTFYDEAGNMVRTFNSKAPKDAATETGHGVGEREEGAEEESDNAPAEQGPHLPAEAGLNQFVWDMRYPPATKVPGDTATEEALTGPLAVPGGYAARLTTGGFSQTVPVVILPDPRLHVTDADYTAQRDLLLAIRDKLSETQEAILRVRALREQAKGWAGRLKARANGASEIAAAAHALDAKLRPIEEALVQAKADDPRQFPIALNAKLATLAGFVSQADGPPARQHGEVLAELSAAIDTQLAALRHVEESDIAAFNRRVVDAALPAVAANGGAATVAD